MDTHTDDARGHVHRAEARLLRIVSLQRNALRLVLDVESGDGRMVRHLLDDKVCAAAPILVRPVPVEDSAKGVSQT